MVPVHDPVTGLYDMDSFLDRTQHLLEIQPKNVSYAMICLSVSNLEAISYVKGIKTKNHVLYWIASYVREKYDTIRDIAAYGYIQHIGFIFYVSEKYLTDGKFYEHFANIAVRHPFPFRLSFNYSTYMIHNQTMTADELSKKVIQGIYDHPNVPSILVPEETVIATDNQQKEYDILTSMDRISKNNYYLPYFQPIYDSVNMHITSAEVLCRYHSASEGIILPCAFIPIFEKHNIVARLDMYIWEQACRILQKRLSEKQKVVPLSINISRKDFFSINVPEHLKALIKKYSIPPELLHLEITETAYENNTTAMISMITDLHTAGFKIYIDDFGNGYSSLTMLLKLSVDVIKIDRELIKDLERSYKSRRILGAMIRMANWLNIDVIAEGVETQQQYDFLQSLGCPKIQGFYLGKPVSEQEFVSLLQECIHQKFTSKNQPTYAMDTLLMKISEDHFLALVFKMAGALALLGWNPKIHKFKILRANEDFHKLFNKMLTDNAEQLFSIDVMHKDDHPKVLDFLKRGLSSNELLISEYRIMKAPEKFIRVSAKLQYLGEENGIYHLLMAFTDISSLE